MIGLNNAAPALTAKEKAFMGKYGPPVLNEYFLTTAHLAVPDNTIWALIKDNDATITIDNINAVSSHILLASGSVGDNDAAAHTQNILMWIMKDLVSTLAFRSEFKISDLAGEASLGLFTNDQTIGDPADFNIANRHALGFWCNNDVVNAVSSDGAIVESTDVSAHVTQNVFSTYEVILTASSALFYIDGTLRATHETRISPDELYYLAMIARNSNAIRTYFRSRFIEVWTE